MPISPVSKYVKKKHAVKGLDMAVIDEGHGKAIVFLHGNPTSSFLWRNIMPYAEPYGRVIAPDLIGMGDSDKLEGSDPDRYSYFSHYEYLRELLDHLALGDGIVLVVHDWGSALGLRWAERNRDRVAGVVFLESIFGNMGWAEFGPFRPELDPFRSGKGEHLVLEDNRFVEVLFPFGIQRKLTEQEMEEYRRPFLEAGEGRRPTLQWPRALPIENDPADVAAIAEIYTSWLDESPIPKLHVVGDPGGIGNGPALERCRNWKNYFEIKVPGIHFFQEDHPDEIGAAIAEWIVDVDRG